MIKFSRQIVLAILLLYSGFQAQAAIIDTSTITVNANGSLNTISGFGSIDQLLEIPNSATFDHFTVELAEFSTSPDWLGLPQSLSLEFRYFSPFSTGNISWNLNTGIFIGKELTVSSSENSAAFDKMQGFLANSNIEIPQIYSTMAWGFGGVDGSATATFLVTAHGEVVPVPVPPTTMLFLSGLVGMFFFSKINGRENHGTRSKLL